MNWLKQQSSTPRIRLRVLMESGQLIDEEADVIQTQLIAHKSGASIRNRETVPLYYQIEEGSPPSWRENLAVDTGLARPPGQDSRYILEDSRNLFKGIRSRAVEIDPDAVIQSHTMQIIANAVAAVVFVGCLWLAGLNLAPDPVADSSAQPTATAVARDEAAGTPLPTPADDAAEQDDLWHGIIEGVPLPEPSDENGTEAEVTPIPTPTEAL